MGRVLATIPASVCTAEHVAADEDVEGGHAEHAAREDDDGKGSDEQPNSAIGEHAVHDGTGAHGIAQQQTARAEEERLWNARAVGRIPRTATARVDGSGAREQAGGKRGRDSREANEQVIDEPGPSEAQQGGTEEDIAATAITAAHGTAQGEAAAEAEAKAEADKRAAEEEQREERRRKDEAERKRQKRERQWQERRSAHVRAWRMIAGRAPATASPTAAPTAATTDSMYSGHVRARSSSRPSAGRCACASWYSHDMFTE